mgnify:CR=1 FL=1
MSQQHRGQETEELTYREAIQSAMVEEMERDDDAFLMGEDVAEFGGVFGASQGMLDQFGEERVRDTPISEAALVGAGAGAAAKGKRPIVELMFSDFVGIAAEQLLNQTAKMRYMFGGQADVPLTIRTTEGGGTRSGAQHSGTMHTWIAHVPGIKAVAPGTPRAVKGLLKSAIRADDPVFVFENKMIYGREGEVPVDDDFTLPLGEASVEREGSDVTVVATQRLLGETLSTAEELAGDFDLEVIDPRSIYPLDTDTIRESVEKTGRLVVADESWLSYGTSSELVARLSQEAFYDLDAPIQRVGVPDVHVPYAPELEDEVLPDGDDVRDAVERLF